VDWSWEAAPDVHKTGTTQDQRSEVGIFIDRIKQTRDSDPEV